MQIVPIGAGASTEQVTLKKKKFACKKSTQVPALESKISLEGAKAVTELNSFVSVTSKLQGCDRILNASQQVDYLCSKLALPHWSAIFNKYEKIGRFQLAIDAFSAFYQQRIGAKQFATLIFAWLILETAPAKAIRVVSLFDNKKINRTARRILTANFADGLGDASALSKDQVNLFFEKMREEPKSERVFFLVSEHFFPSSTKSTSTFFERAFQENLIEAMRRISGVLFNQAREVSRGDLRGEDPKYKMVVSCTMMQRFVDVYGGKNAVQIFLQMGESSAKEIELDGVYHRRTLFLPFPNRPYPEEADGIPVGHKLYFIDHEFYHLRACSDIPPRYRHAFIAYARKILELRDKYRFEHNVHRYLNELYERIIDMEHPTFRKHLTYERRGIPEGVTRKQQLFLFACALQEKNAFNRIRHRLFRQLFVKNPRLTELEFERARRRERVTIETALQRCEIAAQLAEGVYQGQLLYQFNITHADLYMVYSHEKAKNRQIALNFYTFLSDQDHCKKNYNKEDLELLEEEYTVLENWLEHNLWWQLIYKTRPTK